MNVKTFVFLLKFMKIKDVVIGLCNNAVMQMWGPIVLLLG